MANNLPSPRREFPALAMTVKAYLRRFVGIGTHMKKEALFPQDVEHLIDTCGIDTPQQLQREQNFISYYFWVKIWSLWLFCRRITGTLRKPSHSFILHAHFGPIALCSTQSQSQSVQNLIFFRSLNLSRLHHFGVVPLWMSARVADPK